MYILRTVLLLDPVITRYLVVICTMGTFRLLIFQTSRHMKNVAFNMEQKGFLVSYLIMLLIVTVSRSGMYL